MRFPGKWSRRRASYGIFFAICVTNGQGTGLAVASAAPQARITRAQAMCPKSDSRILLFALCATAAWPALAENDPALDSKQQKEAPTAFADNKPVPVLNWGEGDGKSFWIPAANIFLFDFGLNQFNREFSGVSDYDSDFHSIDDNLKGDWVYDSDRFSINQIGHPYQGSMYHGFARAAGLSYWQASAYTFVSSAVWEIAGEITPPSINDQLTTGFGGSFLGEPLFRMASLLLESNNGHEPGLWREIGAAVISPSTGLTRLAYGKRFDGVFRSHDPAVYTRVDVGANIASDVKSDVSRGATGDPFTPQAYREGEGVADFTLAYGLPGKPGYTYDRPFDYFHFEFTAVTSNALENVMSRGLLYGTDYAVGDSYRGIWGLYGTFDYIAPQIFRVSTTSASVGTTGQWWMSRDVALQHTVLLGGGYGSAGEARSGAERDYRSGLSAQGLLALRLIYSDRFSLDSTVRDYRVSDTASDDPDGKENILRADVSLTWRVLRLHGITLKYVYSKRDASFDGLPDANQKVSALSIGYTYLGQTRFGAVDWRPRSQGGPEPR